MPVTDVFISYSTEDRPKAKMLADMIAGQGWTVWWDRHIPPGRTFDDVIEEALDGARCVVVLWSKTSVQSSWVKTEANEGAKRNLLVPVLLDADKIPLEFRRIQAATLADWDGDASHPELKKLFDSIESVVGKPGAPRAETAQAQTAQAQTARRPPRKRSKPTASPAAPASEALSPAPSAAASNQPQHEVAPSEAIPTPAHADWTSALKGREHWVVVGVLVLALAAFALLRSGTEPTEGAAQEQVAPIPDPNTQISQVDVDRFVAQYLEAFNERDVERWIASYAEPANFLGKESADKAYLRQWLAKEFAKYKNTEWNLMGQISVQPSNADDKRFIVFDIALSEPPARPFEILQLKWTVRKTDGRLKILIHTWATKKP